MAGRWMRASNILMFMAGVRRFLNGKTSYDLIHVHTSTWIAGFAAHLGRCFHIPVICKETTLPVFPRIPPFVPWRSRWDRLLLDNWFLALHTVQAGALEKKGIRRNRIFVVPNGVEIPKPAALRRENPGVVLFVGNLTQGIADKGLDTLITAWAEVSGRMAGRRLVIAGRGDTTSLRRLTKKRGCGRTIDFLGFVSDVETLYQQAALIIIPSRREGISNVLLEAQSWGVPAVATDIPGNRKVVSDGESGLLVSVDSPLEMAAAVNRILEDHPLRERMGRAARLRSATMFSIEMIAQQIYAVYRQLVAGRTSDDGRYE